MARVTATRQDRPERRERRSSSRPLRAALAGRLLERRAEIEGAILTRIHAISDPGEAADTAYALGLRAAVSAALDYGLEGIERGGERALEIPVALLAQARMAARNGITLDTVLRRYFAGHALLGDFLVEETERDPAGGDGLKRLLRTQAVLLDRLLAAIGEEYAREAESRPGSSQQRRAELVDRLLAGELADGSELGYDFEGWHLGILATGNGATEAISRLAASLDCRLLLVSREADTVWAWLGSRRRLDPAQPESVARTGLPKGVFMALGEPGRGLAGWCLTHRQAAAALPIVLRNPESIVRYADVALVASVLQDELLAAFLRESYLVPIEEARVRGEAMRETLRTYIAAGCNTSSTAAALKVSRHTVASRLRGIEERLGRPLGSCTAELEVALRVEEAGCADLSNSRTSRD